MRYSNKRYPTSRDSVGGRLAHPDRPQPAVKTGSERIGEDCQRGPPLAADELDSGREEGTPYPGADDRWFDKEKGQVEFLPSPTGRNRVNTEKKFARALGYEKKTLRDHRFGDCESCCHLRHELGVIA